MTESKIEPALTAEEWLGQRFMDDDCAADIIDNQVVVPWYNDGSGNVFAGPRLLSLIALANAALPDSDERKLTRERIEQVRDLVEFAAGAYDSQAMQADTRRRADKANAFLDALSAYLPPVDG